MGHEGSEILPRATNQKHQHPGQALKSLRKRNRQYVIGIAGGSASGKSTFARALAVSLKDFEPVILSQDRYFRDWSESDNREKSPARTANRPESILWEAYIDAVKKMLAGKDVQEPAPGSRAAKYDKEVLTIKPGRVLILEGLFTLWSEELRKLLDLGIYIEVEDSERILRRLLRDVQEEKGDLGRAADWIRKDVLPNFPVYTGATKNYADLIIPNTQPYSRAVPVITQGVRCILEGDDRSEAFTLVDWEENSSVPKSSWWRSQGWRR
jgi:uridine kinase